MSESPTTSVETAKTQRYLTFRVDDRSYALPAEAVTEVIRTPPVARVPQGPEGLLGLANLRGAILPVASLRGLLEDAGSSLDLAVKTTCFLQDLADFPVFNEVYATFFTGDAAPARSTVQVAALPMGVLVEVECIALLAG